MIYLFLFLHVFVASSAQIFQVKKNVTINNQIVKLLKISLIDDFEYKIIPVKYNFGNGTLDNMEIKVNFNNKDVKIHLRSVKGLFFSKTTKIWTLRKDPANFRKMQYFLNKNVMDQLNINFYQDSKTLSSILRIVDNKGNSAFQGIIDADKALQPLSNIFKYHAKILVSKNDTNDSKNTSQHIIYKLTLNKPTNENTSKNENKKFLFIKEEIGNFKPSKGKSKLGTPDVVYPQIMVVLDQRLFSYFEYNVEKAVYYVLSYWNAVDLLFRRLEYPKIRLNIAGIILVEEKLWFEDKDLLAENMLNSFTRFLFDQNQMKFKIDYDAAMLMTGQTIKKTADNKIKGRAFVGTACWDNNFRKQVFAASVVTHKKFYNTIISTVHELAHLFGASHDGFNSKSYFGGPGGKECFANDGYIMSHKRKNKNQFEFSKCSLKSMTFFFSRKNADCLRNKPYGTSNSN